MGTNAASHRAPEQPPPASGGWLQAALYFLAYPSEGLASRIKRRRLPLATELLDPGERLLEFMPARSPLGCGGTLLAVATIGLFALFSVRSYLVVITDQRLILRRTRWWHRRATVAAEPWERVEMDEPFGLQNEWVITMHFGDRIEQIMIGAFFTDEAFSLAGAARGQFPIGPLLERERLPIGARRVVLMLIFWVGLVGVVVTLPFAIFQALEESRPPLPSIQPIDPDILDFSAPAIPVLPTLGPLPTFLLNLSAESRPSPLSQPVTQPP